jgi:hypothetical protein
VGRSLSQKWQNSSQAYTEKGAVRILIVLGKEESESRGCKETIVDKEKTKESMTLKSIAHEKSISLLSEQSILPIGSDEH